MDIGRIPQQSFIPKQPAGQVFAPQSYSRVNPLTVIALIIFLVSLALAGGVFAWVKMTDNTINTLAAQITQIKESFDQPTINLLSAEASKVSVAKELLKNHDAPSLLFTFLEQETLPTVSFSNLSYNYDGSNATVVLSGLAKGFNSLAAESDALANAPGINNPSFSNFTLDASGNVLFSLSFSLKPSLLYYSSSVAPAPQTNSAAVSPTP